MQGVLIELPESSLRVIEKLAKENYRSRKAQIELIVETWLLDVRSLDMKAEKAKA